MAIMLSATNGPDEVFMEVLDSYIFGKITLEKWKSELIDLSIWGRNI